MKICCFKGPYRAVHSLLKINWRVHNMKKSENPQFKKPTGNLKKWSVKFTMNIWSHAAEDGFATDLNQSCTWISQHYTPACYPRTQQASDMIITIITWISILYCQLSALIWLVRTLLCSQSAVCRANRSGWNKRSSVACCCIISSSFVLERGTP